MEAVIEGTIMAVMETWPLQLVVDANGRRYDLRLTEQTTVVRRGRTVGQRGLRPGLRIRFTGEKGAAPGGAALLVRHIEVL